MLRLVTLLATYFIGKSLNHAGGTHGPSPFLFRLPLLMIRKVLKLFMMGFGSLLVGVMGLGFLLKDMIFQMQVNNQIFLTASAGISIVVGAAGFGLCAWTFRKKNWVDAGDLTVPAEPMVGQEARHQPDLMTALTTIASDFLNEKANRRASAL